MCFVWCCVQVFMRAFVSRQFATSLLITRPLLFSCTSLNASLLLDFVDNCIKTKSIVSLMAPPQAESSIVVPLYARRWSYVSRVLRDTSHREFQLCLTGETCLRFCSAESVAGTHSLFERHSTR